METTPEQLQSENAEVFALVRDQKLLTALREHPHVYTAGCRINKSALSRVSGISPTDLKQRLPKLIDELRALFEGSKPSGGLLSGAARVGVRRI